MLLLLAADCRRSRRVTALVNLLEARLVVLLWLADILFFLLFSGHMMLFVGRSSRKAVTVFLDISLTEFPYLRGLLYMLLRDFHERSYKANDRFANFFH